MRAEQSSAARAGDTMSGTDRPKIASLDGESIGRHYGRIRADLERRGLPIGGNELWIAAHALSAGLTPVTANVREFVRVPDLVIEDWTV
ncbi:MAG: hypothetical protein PGN34_03400 [Methylobacterium frigidaeris]